jgi:hypothetical protein
MRASAALAPVLVASLAAVLAAGCGSSQPSQRHAVASYITQAGKIEAELATPLGAVTQAGTEFAQAQGGHAKLLGGLLGTSAEPTLLGAWNQIESLRNRLASLPAPAPAARLRSLLLELVDTQARVARELARLVAFVPRFAEDLGPLGPATARLQRALSEQTAYGATAVAAAYASKAGALRRFQATVDGIRRRLAHLRPPPVSLPSYRAQLAALKGMSTSAARLAEALAGGAPGGIQPLLADFDRAAVSTQTNAVHRAQAAAIRVYDAQSGQLADLSRQIDQERLRLGNTLR